VEDVAYGVIYLLIYHQHNVMSPGSMIVNICQAFSVYLLLQ